MADAPGADTKDLSNEQKLALAAISLLTPAIGGIMGGKQGAMAGAVSGLGAAAGAATDIGKEQTKLKDAKIADVKRQKERKENIDDAVKIFGDKEKLKSTTPKEAKPPTTRSFNGKLEQWDPNTKTWSVIATEDPKPLTPQQTQFLDTDGNPLVFDPNTKSYIKASAPPGTKKPGDVPKQNEYAAATYGRRAEQAEQVFGDLEAGGYNRADISSSLAAQSPVDAAKSPQLKSQEQAEKNFLTAVLRKESGASISPSEMKNGEAQYFPRAGDSPEVIAQKRANRLQATAGLHAEAGKAWDLVPAVGGDAPPKTKTPTAEEARAELAKRAAAKGKKK